jgi:prolyl-tRNA synthetase
MYPIFSLWIRSHADLPLKTFQIVNTFRYETKQTRAFIRVREIHFFEAHTCHKDFEDAENQIREDRSIANRLLRKLCLPFILSKRPEWDKFAGAYYTISIDVLMPSGRTLQVGSIHQYRDNFSRPYNITYETQEGEHAYCHQTTYGMSERLLGAIIGIHGDDKGIVLPPEVAPIQVVIIPIIFKGKEEGILEACNLLHEKLKKENIRSHVDMREITPGSKYYDWELKGIPLRVEIGPKDVERKELVIARRDTGEKITISQENAIKSIKDTLEKIDVNMFENAKKMLYDNIHKVLGVEEAKEKKGIVEIPWCGTEECALEIENTLEGNTLGEPIENTECKYPCPVCGKPAQTWMRFAKTY